MSLVINNQNYAEEGVARLTSVFSQDELHKSLIEIFCSPYQTLQEDLIELAENMFNIEYAEKSQLDMIGALIGQSRDLVDFDVEPYFGFEGAYQSETFGTLSNPDVGGYWNSYSHLNIGRARKLTDEEYRRVIKARTIKNTSNCSVDSLLRVVNLLTNRKDAVVRRSEHRVLKIKFTDDIGLMAYFLDRLDMEDSILPVAFGVRLESE